MSLREKWFRMIQRTVNCRGPVRAVLTVLPGSLFFGIVGLFIFLSLKVDKLLGLPKPCGSPVNIVVAVPVLSLGLFLMLWSVFHFAKVKGTPVPLNPPPKLVTTGPYAYTRNPMLTGLFVVLFGLGLLLQSIGLFCIFTPLFIVLNVLEIRVLEEPELEKRLGEDYLRYKEKVPMFFPQLKRRKVNAGQTDWKGLL